MTTAALVTMITTMTIVTAFVGYFFVKMLRTPPRREPDSSTEQDDVR